MKKLVLAAAAIVAGASASARSVECFTGGWSFARNGAKEFAAVDLSHDWAIARPFDPNGVGNTGKLPWQGEGVYRDVRMVVADVVYLADDSLKADVVRVNGSKRSGK